MEAGIGRWYLVRYCAGRAMERNIRLVNHGEISRKAARTDVSIVGLGLKWAK